MRHPLFELTRARLVEFVREPAAVFWVFGFPILLTIALGLAFRSRVPDEPQVAVVSGLAREAAALKADASIGVRELSEADAARALRLGEVALVVARAEGDRVTVRFDPTRPESGVARLAVERALDRAAGATPRVALADEHVSEPGGRYVDFLVPGLIGLNIMGSSLWGIGYAVVSTRSRRLLKRFAATPMRRSHYLLSFILSRLVFLAAEVAIVLGFAALAFDLEVRGGALAVAVVSLLGALAFAGVSLLVSARTANVEVANGLMNAVTMPMWLLSGTFFSYAKFPEVLQPLIQALPLTALNDALRAVVNEGAPLSAQAARLGVLAAWGVATFVVALRTFRWQ